MPLKINKIVGFICGIICAISFGGIWIAAFIIDLIKRCLWFYRISDIHDRHVLVTGANSGIGFQVSLALAKQGLTVYAACRQPGTFGDVYKAAEEYGPEVIKRTVCIKMDITKPEDVAAAAEEVATRLPSRGLWAIVHNAGVTGPLVQDEWYTLDDYQKSIDVNFIGHVRVTQAFRPLMRKKDGGRIVFNNSYTTICMAPYCGTYSNSKSAERAYFRTLCCENALTNTKVISVTPGYFRTHLLENMTQQYWDKWRNMPDDEKKMYPYEMAAKRDGFMTKFIEFASRFNDVEDVAEAFVNAVTSKWPVEDTYVGWDSMSARMVSSAPYSASLLWVAFGRLVLGDSL